MDFDQICIPKAQRNLLDSHDLALIFKVTRII